MNLYESYANGVNTCAICLCGVSDRHRHRVKFRRPILDDEDKVVVPSGAQFLCESCYQAYRDKYLKI
jgi:hypothetical protein